MNMRKELKKRGQILSGEIEREPVVAHYTKEDDNTPRFDVFGRVIEDAEKIKKKKKKRIKLILTPVILLLIIAVLYVPELLYKDQGHTTIGRFANPPDIAAVSAANNYISDQVDKDFDGDGLDNEVEDRTYQSNIWDIDSDGDGISDYAEVTFYKTSPVKAETTLASIIQKRDQETGMKATSPYQMSSVILWADDINSKAFGGVVETRTGYHFYRFHGYAQFPSASYAYAVQNGIHVPLSGRDLNGTTVWRINGTTDVFLSDKQLQTVHQLVLFGRVMYLNDNFFTGLLSTVLPDHAGIAICRPVTELDVSRKITVMVENEITLPEFDLANHARFGHSCVELGEVADVYAKLDAGKTIACSFLSPSRGENIGIIYGYTDTGDFLVADMETMQYAGILEITARARPMITKTEDEYADYRYFIFNGLGYSSAAGDRINFFAY